MLGHGELADERSFLMDRPDAERSRHGGRQVSPEGVALQDDLRAGVSGIGTCHQSDEGGFAGSVRAHEGVDLTGADVEVDPFEHLHVGEGLPYPRATRGIRSSAPPAVGWLTSGLASDDIRPRSG